MTVSTTDNRKAYSGDSATTVFSFPYKFLANADLVVISKVTSTGVETTKTLTTDYTVTGAGGATGGNVTMLVAPATGTTLTIYSDPAATQGINLVENDPLPAETAEGGWDRLTIICQRLKDLLARSVRLTEGYSATFDPRLPATLTANCALAISADGLSIVTTTNVADLITMNANVITVASNTASSTASAAAALASQVAAAASAVSAAASAALVFTTVNSSSGPVTINASDKGKLYQCDTTAGAFQMNLPAPAVGFFVWIKDTGGLFGSNPVTIHRNGAETFENIASDYTCDSAYGIWKIYSDGTNYRLS